MMPTLELINSSAYFLKGQTLEPYLGVNLKAFLKDLLVF